MAQPPRPDGEATVRTAHPFVFVCVLLSFAILRSTTCNAHSLASGPLPRAQLQRRTVRIPQMDEAASDSSDLCTLDSIRDTLMRLEDTIIFALIERAKFPLNFVIYQQSFFKTGDFPGSLLDLVFQKTEAAQSQAGRYLSEAEVPFNPGKLEPPLIHNVLPKFLHPPGAAINMNNKILDAYLKLLPTLTDDTDNSNYALTAAADITCLQAIARRINIGKFVAEAKYRKSPEDYNRAIKAKDKNALMKLLTVVSQEQAVLNRVEKKAAVFGQNVTVEDGSNCSSNKANYKIAPSIISGFYNESVIPITKDVEVEYLLVRLDPTA